MRDIGKNIRSLREGKHLTQDQLAERLFVTRQTVSNYETGRSRPDVEMLVRIAEALDVDVDTVIYGSKPSPEDRLERKTLVVSCLLTVFLGIIWFVFAPAAQAYKRTYFEVVPLMMLHVFVCSGLLMMLGWTLMQFLCVFFGLKRLGEEKCLLFRRTLLTLVLLWMLLILPPVADMLRMWIIRCRWLQTHDQYSSMEHALPGVWHDMIWNRISSYLLLYINKYRILFLIAGVSLWLTGSPKIKAFR